MKLVIGGYAQGKLPYVQQKYQTEQLLICEGRLPEKEIPPGKTVVIHHFHLWFKERLLAGGNPEEEIRQFTAQNPGVILISDEVGNGIVPVEACEREYRERLGRTLVLLAEQAEEVERILCGLGQKLK